MSEGRCQPRSVFFLEPTLDSPRLKVGDRLGFFAKPESTAPEASRRMFLFSCGGAETPTREIMSRLGVGRTPRQHLEGVVPKFVRAVYQTEGPLTSWVQFKHPNQVRQLGRARIVKY